VITDERKYFGGESSKKLLDLLHETKQAYICGLEKRDGPVAERLGRGLQNLVQRFESARDLKENPCEFSQGFFVFVKKK
jgi:hypothetical protein